MVAPERLTPGIIDRHWIRPMPTALPSEMSATPFSVPCGAVFSITRMATPPSSSAQATIIGAAEHRLDPVDEQKPRMADGRKATATLRTKRQDSGLLRNRPVSTAQKVRQ